VSEEAIEPTIWSHETDCLPDNHRLAGDMVYCDSCRKIVHSANNECMQVWLEAKNGNFCFKCFYDDFYKDGCLELNSES
jgi:hypothetical protein